ncbi:MAG: LCP family glycopolymer transferase [Armatimonadota bacterium]
MNDRETHGMSPSDAGAQPVPEHAPSAPPTASLPPPVYPRRRWWLVVAWAIPVVVLFAGGLALGLYLYTLSQITVGTGEATARRQRSEAFGWPLRLADRVNILIIGVDVTLDNRRRVLNVARADSLLLVSFDPERRRISAVSIPRDTRVQIPGYGETKVNASYAYGGPRLTIKTVEKLLGVTVDHYVKLGAESFSHIIDAVGGIEIDVEKDMKYTDTWAGFSVDLKKGRQHLDGQQATGYIRFRHDATGDIGRVERQHKVMMTLVRQLRQPSTILAGPRLLRVFAENTETTLTPAELATLGLFALRTKEAPLRIETLPGGFAPEYWDPDTPRVRALVADIIYGVSRDELTKTVVDVQNASGSPALGRRIAERMTALGFRTVKVRTAAPTDRTVIIDRSANPRTARMVAAALGKAKIRREPGSVESITVVVGRDAARPPATSRNGL